MTWLAAAVTALLAAAPAGAILPADADTESAPVAAPVAIIDDTQEAGADDRIAGRIRGIFGELPAFGAVQVEVRSGVVSLTGTVPSREDIDRAEAIASRVSGVVTVENSLERNVSIEGGGTGLASLAGKWSELVRLLPLIGVALALWAAIALAGYFLAGLTRLWRRIAPNSFLADLIASAIRFTFVVGGLVLALDMLGASALLGAVLGGAGVVGIALGFAMRDTIENYVASLMLSLRQPFRANDHVVIDGNEGRVIRLTSRATVLMTLDGNHLRIPNGQVFKSVILNYTRNPQRRLAFDLGVDADDDIAAARALGRETLANLPFTVAEPAPEARVVEVGESNVLLSFFAWIDQREADFYKARSEAILATKAALEAGGFSLPEPIYRLRFDPRSATLPFENVAEPAPRATPAAKPSAAKPAASQHVGPDNEIADMVERERAASGGEQDQDLLDTGRPVE